MKTTPAKTKTTKVKGSMKTAVKTKKKPPTKGKGGTGKTPSYTFVSTRGVYVARDHMGTTKSFSVSKFETASKAEAAAKKWTKDAMRRLGF